VVRYVCGAGEIKAIRRAGLCTSYLESKLQSWLIPLPCTSSCGSGSGDCDNSNGCKQLRIFLKPSIEFCLPGSSSPPLLLVGPGTGIAPFIGFIQHRERLDADRSKGGDDDICTGLWRGSMEIDGADLPDECNSKVAEYMQQQEPGPIHLFTGSRDERDSLYTTELVNFLREGNLTSLEVALSRVTSEKVYVQHKILARAEELASLLIEDNANVYVCGDGNRMARDVFNAFIEVLMRGADMSNEGAAEYLADCKLRRRYVQDIWS
jgi:sulfite reductase alpha subunit-like flavoprotein